MWMKMNVPECDFTNTKYSPAVEGAGLVQRGRTGRWCIVMYCGPEHLATQEDAVVYDVKKVREMIEKNLIRDAQEGDWCDF